MATKDMEYSLDKEIANFFDKTTVTRPACDTYAREHLGGNVSPVYVQGNCRYTIYAGPNAEFIAQFRLKSLYLRMETMNLARSIHGPLVPEVAFKGVIGEEIKGKEPLYIYVMNRMPGMGYVDFILAHSSHVPDNSAQFSCWRKNLITDVARFFAVSWKSPQSADESYRDGLRRRYEKELGLLLTCLPHRFRPLIQESLNMLPEIFSLPMVLLHQDFSGVNLMVNDTCNLVGVIDWAEAEIAPFGLNLDTYQGLISHFHLKNGWEIYDDYIMLEELFWSTFSEEAGGLDDKTVRVIKAARITGLLLSRGFTIRLANMPEPSLFGMTKVEHTICSAWMGR